MWKRAFWIEFFCFFLKNSFTEKSVGERDFAQFPHCATLWHCTWNWKNAIFRENNLLFKVSFTEFLQNITHFTVWKLREHSVVSSDVWKFWKLSALMLLLISMHIGIIFCIREFWTFNEFRFPTYYLPKTAPKICDFQTIIRLSAYSELLRFLKWLEIDLQSLIFLLVLKSFFDNLRLRPSN